jgi:hypothetical protein
VQARSRSFEIKSSLPNLHESKRFFFEKLANNAWRDKLSDVPRFFCRNSNGEIYKIVLKNLTTGRNDTCANSEGVQVPCITFSEASRRVSDPKEAFLPVPPPPNFVTSLLTKEWGERLTVKLLSPREEVARAIKLHLSDLGVEVNEIDRVIKMLDAA